MDSQLLRQFKILLIGDSCLDEYQYGTVDRISPEAPVPIFKYSHKETRPGMSDNVLVNLEKLGCQVIQMSGETSIKTRLIDIRSRQQIIRIDDDKISKPLSYNDILYALNSIDAIVISDYNKGFVSYELVVQLRRNYTGPIFIDTKKTELSCFEGCYVKINAQEYASAKTLPKDVIITRGELGAEYQECRYPAKQLEVVDVCGAGDTFLSALTYSYLLTNNIESAIEFAICASAVTVQHHGVYAPSLEEII